MADPLSIVAGVTGLVDIAARSSMSLHALYVELKTADSLILALANEVSDLSIVLGRLDDARDTLTQLDWKENSNFIASLDRYLEAAKATLLRLFALSQRVSQGGSSVPRAVKWLSKRKEANDLKCKLKEVRTKINDILIAQNISISTRIRLEVDQVRIGNSDNQVAMVNKLDAMSTVTEGQLAAIRDMVRANPATALPQPPSYSDATGSFDGEKQQRAIRNSPPACDSNAYPLVSFSLSMPGRTCVARCPCRCHGPSKPSFTWTLPKMLQNAIGHLFLGYTGCPEAIPTCDLDTCMRTHQRKMQVKYTFPLWFVHYGLQGLVEASTAGSLRFMLVAKRRTIWEHNNILWLTQYGQPWQIKDAVAKGATVLDIYNVDGRSLLHLTLSAPKTRIDNIKYLLENGADPDQEDDSGVSARIRAGSMVMLKQGPPETLSALEEIFPVSQWIDEFDLTYLHKVVLGYYPVDVASVVQRADLDIQRQLNAPDRLGNTPLVIAAGRDDPEAAEALITAGAHLNDRGGKCPALIAAILSTNQSCVDLLLSHGAAVGFVDPTGRSPLHWAAYRNYLRLAKKLVAAGAPIDLKSSDTGSPPLSYATRNNNVAVVEYLIDAGASMEGPDNKGETPICKAVVYNAHECLAALLLRNANHLHITNDGSTILHLAAFMGDVETMNLLASYAPRGLNVHARDGKGRTAREVLEKRQVVSEELEHAFWRLFEVALGAQFSDSESVGEKRSWGTDSPRSQEEVWFDCPEEDGLGASVPAPAGTEARDFAYVV